MEKVMMMDYRNENGDVVRVVIDDMEFCVKYGMVHFIVSGKKLHIPLEHVIQVYLN